jgi:hypothetical protein
MTYRVRPDLGPEPQRGGGCLRSCLIASLVLVVLLVAGGVGGFILGRAYIARQLPEWEARYPALGIATGLLHLRGDLSAPGEQPGGPAAKQAGANDRALLPADLPVYAYPLAEAYSIAEAHATGYQRVAESYDAVLAHVRESMPRHGWELVAEQPAQGGQLLLWQKGERDCQIEVVAYEGASELWLRCGGGG